MRTETLLPLDKTPVPLQRQILYFGGDETVEIRSEPLLPPDAGEIQVRTRLSAISSGTEQLVYGGNVPEALLRDASIDALRTTQQDVPGASPYPMPYGYACVGEIIAVGEDVDHKCLGQRVFAFYPHASHFNVPVDSVIPLPATLSDEDAACLPNVETAVGLVMDGVPKIGERVAVFGLGVVGLLTVSLLSDMPLDALLAIDPDGRRRNWALETGATHAAAPNEETQIRDILQIDPISTHDPTENEAAGADLVFELSGQPNALNDAITACGYGGRIIVGSWYGTKAAAIKLGGRFHRQHVSIRSSQVSTIGPEHRARWSKQRRMSIALNHCRRLHRLTEWSEKYPLSNASRVYERIARGASRSLRTLFTYPSE